MDWKNKAEKIGIALEDKQSKRQIQYLIDESGSPCISSPTVALTEWKAFPSLSLLLIVWKALDMEHDIIDVYSEADSLNSSYHIILLLSVIGNSQIQR